MRLHSYLVVLGGGLAAALTVPSLAFASSPQPDPSPFRAVIGVPLETRGEPTTSSSQGNRLTLVSNGYDALLLRVHLIRQAKTSIAIQTFIWTNDECGRLLIYELIEAARRGVKVRIIADHLFSDQDPDVVAFLASVHPNFEVKHYRPATSRMKPSLLRTLLVGLRSFRTVNQRMHSKVMIFDDAILVTGGRNIENTYYDHATALNFRDRDVLAIGPVVRTAVEEFEQFWNYRYAVSSRDLVDVDAALKKGVFKRFNVRADYHFGPYFGLLDKEADDGSLIATRFVEQLKSVDKAMFVFDVPGKSRKSAVNAARTTRELRAVLEKAKKSVVIQTPYLVLSPPARSLFFEMQRKNPGLQVRISTNSFASTDNLFAYSANYRLRNDYVQDLQLHVHEFKPHPGSILVLFPRYTLMADLAKEKSVGASPVMPFLSLHAKSLVIDDEIAFVGSYNLDPRSEDLNTEVGLLVEDSAFARELREEIERDMLPENSWVIARRRLPLRLEVVNGLVDEILSLAPLDLWPIQNTSSFELLPGTTPVQPDAPSFYERYRDVGSFPGTDGLLSQKEILTRLFKAVGAPLTPIL
jgi:phosphatidylserine/phosphatidylglycerophosphate/cardiolipin synthase-like enzyme